MKAVRIHRYGDVDVLVHEEAPVPVPGTGEVLVRVHAAGINPADWRARQGIAAQIWGPDPFPAILGFDISGEVIATESGTSHFAPGDAIYGMLRFPFHGNGYAQFTTASVSEIALKPRSIDHLHAAALPMGALTAWQALFEHGQLKAGQTVLINGAAGGVGHFAVQLAKAKGARVIGVASGRHEAFLYKIGVDHFIDYTITPPEQVARDIDLVIDIVGGERSDSMLSVLKPGGTLVPVAKGQYSAERASQAAVTVRPLPLMRVHADAAQLAEIAHLVDTGALITHLDAVFPLREAREAHLLGETGHARGKIVFSIEASV